MSYGIQFIAFIVLNDLFFVINVYQQMLKKFKYTASDVDDPKVKSFSTLSR